MKVNVFTKNGGARWSSSCMLNCQVWGSNPSWGRNLDQDFYSMCSLGAL